MRLFGELCPQKLQDIFLHLTHVHKSSASWIAGTEWGNQLSGLHHLDTNSGLKLLLLTCAFLAFLMMFCDKSNHFSSQFAGSEWCGLCVMGRSFASSPFRRLASRCPSFRGFPILVGHDSAPCDRECPRFECGRRHDTLSRLFFLCSMAWQIQQPESIDMACCRTLPTNSIACSQVGPMSLEWPMVAPGGFDQSSLSPSREDANDEHLENAHPAPQLRWRRDALQPPEIQRTRVSMFLMAVFDVFPRLLRNLAGTENTSTSLGLPRTTRSSVSKKFMGKMSFSKLFRYWPPRFRLYGTFISNNVNAGGLTICIHEDLFPLWSNCNTCGYLPGPRPYREHSDRMS